jgi:NADPH:quinone reductase-like Zn-dependent oxidoreductase
MAMLDNLPAAGRRLQSTLQPGGTLRLALVDAPVEAPGPDEVLVRLEAAPINPSDLMTLLAGADPATARATGTAACPETTLSLSAEEAQRQVGRWGQPLPIGLSGAGVVIAAGSQAERMLGRNVTALSLSAGTFAQYVTVKAAECALLPLDVSGRQGADVFCNPITALAIAATVRLEGHAALIHTAAASNLGRMLVGVCREDGIPLVNVVRREEQARMLAALGATHVVVSSAPDFGERLREAAAQTGATIAFDAIGGGEMPGILLEAMEAAAAARMGQYSAYGSPELKQVYIYGHLDRSPTVLHNARYGMLWDVRHWAMPETLARLEPGGAAALQKRVLAGLGGIFASRFAHEISLAQLLEPATLQACARMATGEKFLINPAL